MENKANANKVRIIAEIGVNHNGSLERAIKLVEEAAKCGCSGVKFQIFRAERLTERDTPKVDYQERSGDIQETHYEMLKRLEFSAENHAIVKGVATKLGLDFITTPYDPESVEEAYKVGISRFKVASADLGDEYLHTKINSIEPEEVLLGTGMSNIERIRKTLDVYTNLKPSLLHCVSAYPCEDYEINARSTERMKREFEGYEIGYSDHGIGYTPAVVFAARGITLFERHFTLDKKDDGPDHYASSDVQEMKEYVSSIKRARIILGTSEKEMQEGEAGMNKISKKGIKTKCSIQKNELLTLDNTYAIRPAAKGISVDDMSKVIGKKAKRYLAQDRFVQWDDLS